MTAKFPSVFSALLGLLLILAVTPVARAEDAKDIRGNYHGCLDYTFSATEWATLTSASLENMAGVSTLAASLYWTEIMVKGASATVYVCEAASASCGAGPSNKVSVATGATLVLPLRGTGVKSVAIYSEDGTTAQVCGYFRAVP